MAKDTQPVSLTGSTQADGASTFLPSLGYNEATYDRWRNNTEGTLLASAARTETTVSSTQTNYNSRGVMLFFNVSVASGTGGLTLRLTGVDPVTGTHYSMLVSTAFITTGGRSYIIYPGVSTAAVNDVTGTSSFMVPRQWGVRVVHSDASSYTYSIGYSLIL